MKSRLLGAVCAVVFSFITVSANAVLVSRLGGLAYYDTDADLTWLADANYAQTSGYDADGLMTWTDANSWAASLDVAGVAGRRLANTVDVGNEGATYTNFYQGVDYGYNITTHSELSNLYYNVLGNTAYYDTNGVVTGCTAPNYCTTNTGPFSNIKSFDYWSATELVPDTSYAWSFVMGFGFQVTGDKANSLNAWAVQSGDVSAIPIPPAAWLFASGLLGLIGMVKRKAA